MAHRRFFSFMNKDSDKILSLIDTIKNFSTSISDKEKKKRLEASYIMHHEGSDGITAKDDKGNNALFYAVSKLDHYTVGWLCSTQNNKRRQDHQNPVDSEEIAAKIWDEAFKLANVEILDVLRSTKRFSPAVRPGSPAIRPVSPKVQQPSIMPEKMEVKKGETQTSLASMIEMWAANTQGSEEVSKFIENVYSHPDLNMSTATNQAKSASKQHWLHYKMMCFLHLLPHVSGKNKTSIIEYLLSAEALSKYKIKKPERVNAMWDMMLKHVLKISETNSERYELLKCLLRLSDRYGNNVFSRNSEWTSDIQESFLLEALQKREQDSPGMSTMRRQASQLPRGASSPGRARNISQSLSQGSNSSQTESDKSTPERLSYMWPTPTPEQPRIDVVQQEPTATLSL